MSQPKRTGVLTNAAIVVVLVGWGVNFTAQIVSPTYTPNTHLDSMLLAVLGFLLAGKVSRDPETAIPEQPSLPAGEDPVPARRESDDEGGASR